MKVGFGLRIPSVFLCAGIGWISGPSLVFWRFIYSVRVRVLKEETEFLTCGEGSVYVHEFVN